MEDEISNYKTENLMIYSFPSRIGDKWNLFRTKKKALNIQRTLEPSLSKIYYANKKMVLMMYVFG